MKLKFFYRGFLTILWSMLIFLLIFGNVLNNILENYSLPNLFTYLRILVIFIIWFHSERISYKKSRYILFYILFVIFLLLYLGVAFYQARLEMGFYFFRLYFEPILVLYLASFMINYINHEKLIKNIKRIGLLSVILSLFSLVLFYTGSTVLYFLHGAEEISYNWFLGIGKFIYRAGYPIGGPNQLGLLYASLIILSIIYPSSNKTKNKFYLSIFLLGLFSSFSKSAFLVLLVFCLFYYLSSFKKMAGIFNLFPIGAILFLIGWTLDNSILDGRFFSYLSSFGSVEDGSTMGHLNSVSRAYNNFNEYGAWGYLKGTVGPRAKLFTENYMNVESSFFLVLYDMGLLVASLYFLTVFSLIKTFLRYQYQYFYLMSICLAYLVLPLIHSIEITSMMAIFFMFIGSLSFNLKCYSVNYKYRA